MRTVVFSSPSSWGTDLQSCEAERGKVSGVGHTPPHPSAATRLPPSPTRVEGNVNNLFQLGLNGFKNSLNVPVNLVVPEANDFESARFNEFSTRHVVCSGGFFGVLRAVKFNNQLGFKTYEVNNVTCNRPLTTELHVQETVSQGTPKQLFFGRLFAPQSTSFQRSLPYFSHRHRKKFSAFNPLPLWEREGAAQWRKGEGASRPTQTPTRSLP